MAFEQKTSGLVFLQRHKMMAMVCAGISLSLGVSKSGTEYDVLREIGVRSKVQQ